MGSSATQLLLVRGDQSSPMRTIAAGERLREQMRGSVDRWPIEHANIVDDKPTIFRDYFRSDSPRATGGGPAFESVSNIDCLPEKIHIDQERPVLLLSF